MNFFHLYVISLTLSEIRSCKLLCVMERRILPFLSHLHKHSPFSFCAYEKLSSSCDLSKMNKIWNIPSPHVSISWSKGTLYDYMYNHGTTLKLYHVYLSCNDDSNMIAPSHYFDIFHMLFFLRAQILSLCQLGHKLSKSNLIFNPNHLHNLMSIATGLPLK